MPSMHTISILYRELSSNGDTYRRLMACDLGCFGCRIRSIMEKVAIFFCMCWIWMIAGEGLAGEAQFINTPYILESLKRLS
jgi:hypothetical protein